MMIYLRSSCGNIIAGCLSIMLLLLLFTSSVEIEAWQQQKVTQHRAQPQQHLSSQTLTRMMMMMMLDDNEKESSAQHQQQHQQPLLPEKSFSLLTPRRRVLDKFGAAVAAAFIPTFLVTTTTLSSSSSMVANALIKGNTPPPPKKVTSMDKPKCKNIDDCQALGDRQEQKNIEEAERESTSSSSSSPPMVTKKNGVRYRDMEEGDGGDTTTIVKDGDQVTLAYKVLKLGKRSFDGLSGEGTVIFSRGYGLEDDETRPGDVTWTTTVGQQGNNNNNNNIVALDDALIGMKLHGIRRLSIPPQLGWERPTTSCDGGPGGRGPGGDLKVDYVVVPTATMVATEACLDTTRQPFPTTYAQQRRMAQRFDQTLLMEVQVLDIVKKQ